MPKLWGWIGIGSAFAIVLFLSGCAEQQTKDVFNPSELNLCQQDSDCAEVRWDCCGCANGGRSFAINKNYVGLWEEDKATRCSNENCPNLNVCEHNQVKCISNHCTLVYVPDFSDDFNKQACDDFENADRRSSICPEDSDSGSCNYLVIVELAAQYEQQYGTTSEEFEEMISRCYLFSREQLPSFAFVV